MIGYSKLMPIYYGLEFNTCVLYEKSQLVICCLLHYVYTFTMERCAYLRSMLGCCMMEF